VECIRTFFRRRFKYESALYPKFKAVKAESGDAHDDFQLDVMVAASGFAKKDQKTLEEVRFHAPYTCQGLMNNAVVYEICSSRGTSRPL
jgi:hypothetical protein